MRFYLLSCVIRDAHLRIWLYSFFVKPPALAGFFVLCHLLNTCTSCVCVCCSVESSVFYGGREGHFFDDPSRFDPRWYHPMRFNPLGNSTVADPIAEGGNPKRFDRL